MKKDGNNTERISAPIMASIISLSIVFGVLAGNSYDEGSIGHLLSDTAASQNQPLVLRFLKATGVDLRSWHDGILQTAVESDSYDSTAWLFENFSYSSSSLGSALTQAAQSGNTKMIDLLIGEGADVHYNLDAALFSAFINRKSDAFERLLSYGAGLSELTRGYEGVCSELASKSPELAQKYFSETSCATSPEAAAPT